jgi:hypothetical protein
MDNFLSTIRQNTQIDKISNSLDISKIPPVGLSEAYDRITKNYTSESLENIIPDTSSPNNNIYSFQVIITANNVSPCFIFTNPSLNAITEVEGISEFFTSNNEFYLKGSNEPIEGEGRYLVNIKTREYVQIFEKKVIFSGFCDTSTGGNVNEGGTDNSSGGGGGNGGENNNEGIGPVGSVKDRFGIQK